MFINLCFFLGKHICLKLNQRCPGIEVRSILSFGDVTSANRIKMTRDTEKDEHSEKERTELTEKSKKLSASGSSLTPERLELIIKRIKEKFYDKDEVLETIAERMIKSNEWRDFLKKVNKKDS
jgi:hypothetical protein